MMRNKINYFLPYMKITFTGKEKPLYRWIYETLPAYLGAWKLWFASFFIFAKTYGLVNAILNLRTVSDAMVNGINKLAERSKQKAE